MGDDIFRYIMLFDNAITNRLYGLPLINMTTLQHKAGEALCESLCQYIYY